jgi:hypothetical protein
MPGGSAAVTPLLWLKLRRLVLRGPRAAVTRLSAAVSRRLRRPWSRLYPRLISERLLLKAARCDSIDALWTRQLAAPFFLRPAVRLEWTSAFRLRYPGLEPERITSAEVVLRHEFDLLGSGTMALGSPLPWHDDFKAQKRWPRQFATDIEYMELDRPTDVKVPWELSRCQHFAVLGQAHWLTGDERFAEEFVAEISDWIDANPWGYGVNWACAMDVALRAVSWIWGFYFMGDSRACANPAFRARFLKSLYLHGEHVATHLERGDVNGNHFLSDGVGLVFLGVFFRDTRKGRRWLRLGRQIVVDEIFAQTSADGVDFEQSTAYHRLVLELFFTAYLLLEKAGERPPQAAWDRLQRMLEFVAAYTKPNGLSPLIGDADDGRVQKLGSQRLNDHRYLLSAGAALFGRNDFKQAAGEFWDEAFWLLGPDGASRYDSVAGRSSGPSSSAFPDGGFYVLRNQSAHLIVDCGEVGMRGRGGHGHNDILSFELWMNGANLVTDCGAYLYTASREWRNRFRSTAFHNTIEVDGEELNRFIGPDALWQLHYDAAPHDIAWSPSTAGAYFRGGHAGYRRLPFPVDVTREVFLPDCGGTAIVRDRIAGTGRHQMMWRFHLDPGIRADEVGAAIRLCAGSTEVWLRPESPLPDLHLRLEPGWVSPSYGVRVPTSVVVASLDAELPVSVTWLIGDRDALAESPRLITQLDNVAAASTTVN